MIATTNPRSGRRRHSRSRLAAAAFVAVCLVNAAVRPVAADSELTPREQLVGRLEGQIRLVGEVPTRPIQMKHPNGLAVPDEALEIDPAGQGIGNIFVYLWKPPAGAVIPAPPKEPITIELVGLRFSPHASMVRAGQPLRFVNLDAQPNNVHIHMVRNANVNWLLKPGMQQETAWKRSEKLPAMVRSDILPMMQAAQLILDHPWCAVTDSEGRFTIADLPPGRHDFIVWHELAGYLERKWIVEIAAGQTTTSDVEYNILKFGPNAANRGGEGDDLCAGPFDLEQPGNGDDIVVGRKLLGRQLAVKLNHVDQRVQLTDEQRKKLELAGAGEIEHLLDEVQDVRAELARVKPGGGRLKQFQDTKVLPLRERLSRELFGPRSLFGKAQSSVLTSDQKGRLKADSPAREDQKTKSK